MHRIARVAGTMGPNFSKGKTSIDRHRLPPGFVAILDDPGTLRAAIHELHQYAISPPARKPAIAVVFRTLSEGERQHMLYRLQDLLGMENYTTNCGTYGAPLDSWYVIDSEHVGHSWNRHSSVGDMDVHGQIPLEVEDFTRVPEIVRPSNIALFVEAKDMPRMAYERIIDGVRYVVVMEIRKKGRICLKTMYKQAAK